MGTDKSSRDMVLGVVRDSMLYRKEFHGWLAENWHVWQRFCEEANKAYRAGWTHYSARTIIEVLRHESNLAEVGARWKLNNNMVPSLAQLFLDLHPWAANITFFERRPGIGGGA